MVGINVPIPVPVRLSFLRRRKRSLFGDHAIYGPEGVHFYTRLKTVTSRWPEGIKSVRSSISRAPLRSGAMATDNLKINGARLWESIHENGRDRARRCRRQQPPDAHR